MTLTEELAELGVRRDAVEVAKLAVVEMLRAKAVEARLAGWSAEKIAKTVGVSKRTVQVWTDDALQIVWQPS